MVTSQRAGTQASKAVSPGCVDAMVMAVNQSSQQDWSAAVSGIRLLIRYMDNPILPRHRNISHVLIEVARFYVELLFKRSVGNATTTRLLPDRAGALETISRASWKEKARLQAMIALHSVVAVQSMSHLLTEA